MENICSDDGGASLNSAMDARRTVDNAAAKREGFHTQLESWRDRMESALAARLPGPDAVPTRLHQAMRYSVLDGGKRMRPALLFATARAVGLAEEEVEAAACATYIANVVASRPTRVVSIQSSR
jgi:hypothetical protein